MRFYLVVLSVAFFHFANSVKVSVYYESLCYDSTLFIGRQLYPNYSQLKNHLQLELIPYGKANHIFRNRWIFDCQHGPNECKGNKYQSCGLEISGNQDKNVGFVYCVMKERNPANVKKIENCAKRMDLNWEKIAACVRSGKGDELLAGNGNKTNSLEPNLSFVPTIVYDDKFDDYLQERSLVDFTAVVCSKIKGEKPKICEGKKVPERKNFFDYFTD